MKTDPILQEVWDVKDRLAAEAGYDIRQFVEQLRDWSRANPQIGRSVRNAEEIHRYYEEQEKKALVLREEPPGHGEEKEGDA